MTKAVFIDFHKTLCFGKFWAGLEPETFAKIQNLMFESDNSLINDWMVGTYTSEEINRIISEKFAIPYEAVWAAFLLGCERMRADQKSLDLIENLKDQYRFILVTDNMDSFDRFVRDRMKLNEYFHQIYNSYTTKLLKSDRNARIFKQIMEEHGLKPDECVLIDDSVRVCGIFTDLGGTAHTVTEQQPLYSVLTALKNRSDLSRREASIPPTSNAGL